MREKEARIEREDDRQRERERERHGGRVNKPYHKGEVILLIHSARSQLRFSV